MTPVKHVVASGVTSVLFAFLTRSWVGTMACFLSGIFIDLDHLLDYCIFRKKMCWSIKELEDFCFERTGKIYLILHSYELMAILWVTVYYFGMQPVWFGIIFGMSVHMLLDQIINPVHPLAYFLFYRLKIGFTKAIFFNEGLIEEPQAD